MNKEFKRFFTLPSLNADTKEIILQVATLLIALALTPVKFFFSTYPFGLAICCASKKRTPFAVAGASVGALLFIDEFAPYLIAFLSLVALRLVGSVWLGDTGKKKMTLGKASRPAFMDSLFSEPTSVRVAICALCALGLGIFRVTLGGFVYYDVFVTAFSVVFCSILCYALALATTDSDPSASATKACALLFMIVFALRGKEIFTLDVSMILSYGAILYASWHSRGTHSVALGVLLGICHGVTFAPVFAIGALVSSVLWRFSHSLSLIGALVMSIGYGILTSGYQAIVYLLPELLFASLLMYPLQSFDLLPTLSISPATSQGAISLHKADKIRQSLSGVSSSFKDVALMLTELSARAKSPDRDFYKNLCLEACEKHCFSCPKRSICWERDPHTTKDNIDNMAEGAFSSRILTIDAVDERFLHRCPNIEKITDEINEAKRSLEGSALKSDKLEVCAQDYEIISRLIDHINTEIDALGVQDEQASDRAKKACSAVGLRFSRVEVFGSREPKIVVSGVDTESSKCSLDEVQASLEEALGAPLTEPKLSERAGEQLLTLEGARALDVEFFKSQCPRLEGEESGDTLCAFFGVNEHFYMLLCDGMGSGHDASLTSSICAEFLQRALTSVRSKELCLTMLNNLIRAKSLECSSSVDLLEIDLIGEHACLTKSGAAPSFVKRGSSVFRLHSKTAPIGIMRSLDAEVLDFNLREGDIVIMISDGIASDERDSKYLVDFLSHLEIVDDEDFIDTSSPKGAITTTLTPASASISVSPHHGTNAPSEKKLPLSALPDAIIDLAKSRLRVATDDLSVAVARANRVGRE